MKWSDADCSSMARTPVGIFYVDLYGTAGHYATWVPLESAETMTIGRYRTRGAAKGGCKRYAKRMAAAFKAMGKAGWQ